MLCDIIIVSNRMCGYNCEAVAVAVAVGACFYFGYILIIVVAAVGFVIAAAGAIFLSCSCVCDFCWWCLLLSWSMLDWGDQSLLYESPQR